MEKTECRVYRVSRVYKVSPASLEIWAHKVSLVLLDPLALQETLVPSVPQAQRVRMVVTAKMVWMERVPMK
jgi:hypothetical protein